MLLNVSCACKSLHDGTVSNADINYAEQDGTWYVVNATVEGMGMCGCNVDNFKYMLRIFKKTMGTLVK
jgi:hypothetical protein